MASAGFWVNCAHPQLHCPLGQQRVLAEYHGIPAKHPPGGYAIGPQPALRVSENEQDQRTDWKRGWNSTYSLQDLLVLCRIETVLTPIHTHRLWDAQLKIRQKTSLSAVPLTYKENHQPVVARAATSGTAASSSTLHPTPTTPLSHPITQSCGTGGLQECSWSIKKAHSADWRL